MIVEKDFLYPKQLQETQNLPVSTERLGVVAANQPGYVEAMLTAIQSGQVVVPLRHKDDRDRIQAAHIQQILTPAEGGAWVTASFSPSNDDAIALISFTSGTEGTPKGVMLSHINLANVVLRLNTVMQVDDSIREYVGVPVYHSFGFGRCRAVATAGGQSFIPSNGFNPAEIGEMLKKGEINAISAVPSLWRILLDYAAAIGQYGKRVRWIEIGSQSMSRAEKEAMKALFPNAKIVQHYGLTEASRSTLLEIHHTEGQQLDSVGQALAGVQVQITPEGRIAIRGEHVARSYLINGTEEPLQNLNGWLVTKDLGTLEDGFLYYQGRADDVINCGGIKIHPEALEARIYAAIGHHSGLAVCRKPDPVRGEGFLVAVTQELSVDKQVLRQAVLQSTQELGVNAASAIAIVDVDDLPKTATGKIQRQKLVDYYRSLPAESVPVSTPNASPIQAAFCQALKLHQVHPDDTFITLGGDSLSYVQFSMALERHLGYLPPDWQHLSVRELEQLAPQRSSYGAIESTILFRALAITGVVVNHAGLVPPEYIGGGATLLFIVAGLNLARFQGDALLRGHLAQPLLSLLRNLLIPYFVIAFLYQVYSREFDVSVLFLFSTLIDPHISSIFPVWFIQVLAQCMVLFALPFGVRSFRTYANSSPWTLGCIYLSFWVAVALITPHWWNTDHLYNRVPHLCMWVLILGWCIHFANSKTSKIITTLLLLGVMLIVLPSPRPSETVWMLGTLILLWLPTLPIPNVCKPPIQTISAAAYYIYLTHMIFIDLLARRLNLNSPLLITAIAIVGGTLVWMALQKGQQWIRDRRFAT